MKSKNHLNVITLVLVIAVGAGAWYGGMRYAHTQMEMGSGDVGGMSMGSGTGDMAGMSDSEMAAMTGNDGMKEGVPGYVPITVSPQLQQQIGVRFETVKLAPLKMSVSTVGIVRPDETKVADVYVKTEGWVHEVFVDFMGKKIDEGTPYSPGRRRLQRHGRYGGRHRGCSLWRERVRRPAARKSNDPRYGSAIPAGGRRAGHHLRPLAVD